MKRNLFFFLVFLLLFVFRLASVSFLDLPPNSRIRIRGNLQMEPIIIGSHQFFQIKRIRIKTRRLPEYHFGDSLDLIGELEVRPLNKFIKEYWLVYPEIKNQNAKIKDQDYEGELTFLSMVLSWIYRLRRVIQEAYNKNLPEPFSSLLAGIVLGIKNQLPQKFFEALKRTGTLHVVVASGMNLSFFAAPLIEKLAGILNRFLLIFVSLIIILMYCAMVGFEAPIVRAGIMIAFSYLAAILGRRKEAGRILVFSALAMLAVKPLLLFSLSFQLSLAATSGIIFLEPIFRRKGEKEGEEGWLRSFFSLVTDDFRTTLSAQIGVLPLLVANFGEVSVVSLVVNMLVLWTISYLMTFGFVLALTSLIWPVLAKIAALAVWPLLFWFVKVVEIFGRLPLSMIQMPKISYWLVLMYYLIVGYVVRRKWRLRNNQINQ